MAYHGGVFSPAEVLTAEIDGDYDRYTTANQERWTGRARGKILVAGRTFGPGGWEFLLTVLAAADSAFRDAMRTLVEAKLDQRVRYVELEYQP